MVYHMSLVNQSAFGNKQQVNQKVLGLPLLSTKVFDLVESSNQVNNHPLGPRSALDQVLNLNTPTLRVAKVMKSHCLRQHLVSFLSK